MENKYVEFAKLVALFLAVVLPVPVIGYVIHTPASITISYLSFVIIGLVFPFFWYMAQKKGFGQEYRAYRSVVHVVLWIACLPLLTAVLWYYLPQMELAWRHVGYWLVIPAVLLMTVYLAIITALDHYAVSVYARLMEAHREFLRIWMACTFLIGSIPGMAILSFFGLYALGGGGIDPVSGAYILMSLMWVKTIQGHTGYLYSLYMAHPYVYSVCYLYPHAMGRKLESLSGSGLLLYVPIYFGYVGPGHCTLERSEDNTMDFFCQRRR